MTTLTFSLEPTPPFDFELTAGYHTYFQARSGADTLDAGVYRRLLDIGGKLALASVRSVGTVDEPELTVELQGEGLSGSDANPGGGTTALDAGGGARPDPVLRTGGG